MRCTLLTAAVLMATAAVAENPAVQYWDLQTGSHIAYAHYASPQQNERFFLGPE